MQHAGWDVQLSGVSTKTGSIFVLAVSSWSRRIFCCSSYISNSVSLLDLFQERVRSFDFLILFRRMEETCYWFVFDFLIFFSSSFVSGQSFPFLLFYPILYSFLILDSVFCYFWESLFCVCRVPCDGSRTDCVISPLSLSISLSDCLVNRAKSSHGIALLLPSIFWFIYLSCLFVCYFFSPTRPVLLFILAFFTLLLQPAEPSVSLSHRRLLSKESKNRKRKKQRKRRNEEDWRKEQAERKKEKKKR